MSDVLYSFSEGPYNLLEFEVTAEKGKVVVEINGGDLGRLPIEDVETIERLREALLEAEEYFKQRERRQEEL